MIDVFYTKGEFEIGNIGEYKFRFQDEGIKKILRKLFKDGQMLCPVCHSPMNINAEGVIYINFNEFKFQNENYSSGQIVESIVLEGKHEKFDNLEYEKLSFPMNIISLKFVCSADDCSFQFDIDMVVEDEDGLKILVEQVLPIENYAKNYNWKKVDEK